LILKFAHSRCIIARDPDEKREERALKVFMVVASGFLFLFTTGVLWADQEKEGMPQAGLYLSLAPSALGSFTVETTSPLLSPGKISAKRGEGISAGLGYRYGDFRVEGEIMYGRNNADHVSFSGGGGDLSGYFDMWGATANLFYDIPTGVRFRPYVGAGLGGVILEAHDVALAGFPPTRGRNTLFTYQLMAGVSYALTDAWHLLLEYRFSGMGGQDYETGGVPLHGDPIQIHAVQTGVRFYF
jgi:opacity protein-like surface antigen